MSREDIRFCGNPGGVGAGYAFINRDDVIAQLGGSFGVGKKKKRIIEIYNVGGGGGG